MGLKEATVDKQTLLRKLDAMLEEFARNRSYGLIEIQISDGVPALLRKSTTEKLQNTGEQNRVTYHRQSNQS